MTQLDSLDEHFLRRLAEAAPPTAPAGGAGPALHEQLVALFDAQAQSRHLDLAARQLQKLGEGFYTIGSAGHESNAALGLLSAVTDPALLHYRSGGFYAARANAEGSTDPVRDMLRSLTCAVTDPASGGRHKVFGHPKLHIIPQTSTIASHLPRAVGLAFALGLADLLDRPTPWPEDAVVLCSFGDASANHSTATGALNAAAYLTHRHRDCPVLFVCEDNGIGISTRSPRGWPAAPLRALPGLTYVEADGDDPVTLLETTAAALASVRRERRPAVLRLRTVRFGGHAGSDVETAYRSKSAIDADLARDPLLATARALVAHGVRSPDDLRHRYEEIRHQVRDTADEVRREPRLTTRAAVTAPLAHGGSTPAQDVSIRPSARSSPTGYSTTGGPDWLTDQRTGGPTGRWSSSPSEGRIETPAANALTLAQSINHTLAEAMAGDDGVLVFGEDVAAKGGVYGVTRGLQRRFGERRVFDSLLDEQTILGTALGAGLAGFLPVPEIQYLAYLHNAEDQLRGEAASLRFFSDGQYENPMVLRIAGLAYQKGFGGHFHNDNSVAVLRDIPGLVVAVPSHPATAPALLRSCLHLARTEGRVCVFLEPIARYHERDLREGDQAWLAPYDATSYAELGEVTTHHAGRSPVVEVRGPSGPEPRKHPSPDLLLVTFGNGVHLSRRAAATLAEDGVACTVLDLQWLSPLPVEAVLAAADEAAAVLVVDETRASGGVADAIVAALAESGCGAPLASVRSADSFIPLGPAAATVLLGEDEVVAAARRLTARAR